MMLEEESLLQRIVRGVVQIVVVIALARLCVYSFGTVGTMPGQSMRPALEDGDQVLLDRLSLSCSSAEHFPLSQSGNLH